MIFREEYIISTTTEHAQNSLPTFFLTDADFSLIYPSLSPDTSNVKY